MHNQQQAFQDEIVSLARQIAWRQRGEDHLQPVEILTSKFYIELQELADASNPWDEIPDVVYYASCLAAQGEGFAWTLCRKLLAERGVSLVQAQAATLAKYRLRAAGNPKDIAAERDAIMQALTACERE